MKTFAFAVVLLAAAVPAVAQDGWVVDQDDAWCDNGNSWGSGSRYCEVRTTTLDPRDVVRVNGDPNGGIRVIGWNRNEIELKVKVQVHNKRGDDLGADDIFIDIDGDTIRADGPRNTRGGGWSASYRLMVPERSDLDLSANNGGITIRDVDGEIRFRTQNGGVNLEGLAGDVKGRTQNGGVSVELDGGSWYGEGMDVQTTNGGVVLRIPDGYDAELETGTVNGTIDLDFPVMVQGKIGRRLNTTLGSGGPLVRVTTTNGGVKVKER